MEFLINAISVYKLNDPGLLARPADTDFYKKLIFICNLSTKILPLG